MAIKYKTSVRHSRISSLEIELSWMKGFINRLLDLSQQFSFLKNDIENLALVFRDMEALVHELKANGPGKKIAASEKNMAIKNAFTAAQALIEKLKTDPNWAHEYEKMLKINMLPLKSDAKMIRRMSRQGIRFYSQKECMKFMVWIKDISQELTKDDNPFRIYEKHIIDLQAGIERAENALNHHNILYASWVKLSEKIDVSLPDLRADIKSIVKRLKASRDWNADHALMLGANDMPVERNFENLRPEVRLKAQIKHVSVNFLKDGIDGMNVYSRLKDELNFFFLGYAKRSPYRDPRPVVPGKIEIREYYVTAVIAGKEVGHQSEIASIRVGDK